jgi:hypothetical protein
MTKILPVLGGHDATAQMVAEVLEALRDIQGSSIKRIEDLFAGLTLQLNSLAELLRVLNAPEKIKHMPAEKHDTLAGTLLEVHYVVYQLKNLVFIAKSGVNRRGKLLWGAKSICTGFEIRLKRRLDQFESLKAMLEQQVADLASASASAKGVIIRLQPSSPILAWRKLTQPNY